MDELEYTALFHEMSVRKYFVEAVEALRRKSGFPKPYLSDDELMEIVKDFEAVLKASNCTEKEKDLMRRKLVEYVCLYRKLKEGIKPPLA